MTDPDERKGVAVVGIWLLQAGWSTSGMTRSASCYVASVRASESALRVRPPGRGRAAWSGR